MQPAHPQPASSRAASGIDTTATPSVFSWRSGALIDGLLLLCLFLSGLRLVTGLENVVDLGLFDETGYLYAGTHLQSVGLMPPAWSPLYGIWYFVLDHFQPNPVALYYLNYRLLVIGTPLLIYLLLRAYRLPRLLALLVAWFFLISAANLPVWPKPGSFALCLVLLLLIVTRDLRVPTRSLLVLSLGALLCAYARPEYLLAAGLLFGLYLIVLQRQLRQTILSIELIQLALVLVLAFGLMRIFGLAPLDRNNNRSFEAFAQHYALNWVEWNQSKLDPWTEFEGIIANDFGAVNSMTEAMRANPGAVIRHVQTNLVHYPFALSQTFLMHFNPLLPAQAPWAASASVWLLGSCLTVAVLWALLRQRSELRERLRAQRLRLLILALLAAPALSSAIIIYPRTHYLLLHGVLLALIAGLLLSRPERPGKYRILAHITVALALVAITPSITATWFASPPALYPHANRSTVEAISALQIAAPTNILEDEGGFHVYLGDQFKRVGAEQKNSGMLSFIKTKTIDMIVVSAKLRQDQRYRNDPEWQQLLDNPGSAGFTSLPIPGTDRQLLYRK